MDGDHNTPVLVQKDLDELPFRITFISRFDRKDWISSKICLETLYLFSLWRRHICQTLPKAFEMSNATASA